MQLLGIYPVYSQTLLSVSAAPHTSVTWGRALARPIRSQIFPQPAVLPAAGRGTRGGGNNPGQQTSQQLLLLIQRRTYTDESDAGFSRCLYLI